LGSTHGRTIDELVGQLQANDVRVLVDVGLTHLCSSARVGPLVCRAHRTGCLSVAGRVVMVTELMALAFWH